MVTDRLAALPHHLDLMETIAGDVRRHLDRMGRMRGLTIVQVGPNGAYRISVTPAATVRPTSFTDFGLSPVESMDVVDAVFDYDPQAGAAILVAETNPVDGLLLSFMVLEWAAR